MGFKPLIAIFVLLILIAAYGIGGSETISKKIEQYTEDNFKSDPEKYEDYTFKNITYCDWTAKYARALELLDKYDLRFEKEQYKEKSYYMRAKVLEDNLDDRRAMEAYKKYMDEFPEGKNFEKAKQRYEDLKNYH